jgi:hypothetical protein
MELAKPDAQPSETTQTPEAPHLTSPKPVRDGTQKQRPSIMAKPLEERSDDELKRGLAEGEFGDKKAVVAEEILRRRQAAKVEDLKRKYTWFGSILAALSMALVAFRRFWRK